MSATVSAKVLKAMGMFGGVRMLQILFGVIRTKLIAVWLGPAGVGLFGIFNGAVDTVKTLAQLGMRSSSVRDIAGQTSPSAIAMTVTVVRRWGWLLGVTGAVLMAACAPLLSRLTFGDSGMTLHYMALAAVIFFLSIASAEEAVMQGLGALAHLARASVWGAVAGFVVSVPMYYFWGLASVVPSIIAYSLATCIATYIYRVRGVRAQRPVGVGETLSAGKRFIILGLYMTTADFVAQALSYVFVAWLNNRGGDTEVGFYQAGYTMVNRYVGLIFTALATEYYPRLSRVATSGRRLSVFVAHEMGLILMLLLPAVTFFVSLAPWLVRILYDSRFEAAVPFITIAMAGIVMRGVSYCMSYVILAKGDGLAFLLTESLSAVAGLGLNIGCYSVWGIGGLGVAYGLWFLLYTVIVGYVYYVRYGLTLPASSVRMVMLTFSITLACIVVAQSMPSVSLRLLLLPVPLIASVFVVRNLRKRLRR